MNFYEKYFDEIEHLIAAFQAALPDDVRQGFTKELSKWEGRHPGILKCSAQLRAT